MFNKKLLFVIILILKTSYGFCINNFNITLRNHSRDVIKLTQGQNVHWNNSGQLWHDQKVTVTPWASYSWHVNDTLGWYDYDYLSFYLTVPQQTIGTKNYASIFNLTLENSHMQPTRLLVNGEHSHSFNKGQDNHTLIITVNPDLTVTAQYDQNTASWVSDTPGHWQYGYNDNDDLVTINRRAYDDVYGGNLSSPTALYEYYKAHPELVPVNMRLNDESKTVILVSHGHLSGRAGYQSFLQTTLTPIKSGALCQYANGSNVMVIPGKVLTLGTIDTLSPQASDDKDAVIPDPASVIRPDFAQQIAYNPESYYNWTGAPYNKSLNITSSDLNAYSFTVQNSPIVSTSYADVVTAPKPARVNVVLGGAWDNTTLTNQTYNTLSYTNAYTTSTTNTLTNGWKAGFKGSYSFKTPISMRMMKVPEGIQQDQLLKGWTLEFSVEYSGSYSTATTQSTTVSVSQPSQPIQVPPGCHIDVAIHVYEADIDTDYTAYGTLDGHLQYVMTTPWANMKNTSSLDVKPAMTKSENKYTKFGRSGILPSSNSSWSFNDLFKQ